MGTVYYGRHEETDKEAAIKILPASLSRESGFIARFAREIDALRQLSNPNVIEPFESGVDGDTYYYAMEYINGETLMSKLRREKRIPWREAIEIALPVCSALKAAHDAGIIHRDLKPSNLMLGKDGEVKLTDFGVAQVFAGTRLTATGGVIGTAEYMSPEQAQGKRATKKSDLYSLGALLYVMVTGRPPFTGKTTLDVIQKQKYGLFDRPSKFVDNIPHWLEDVIIQLLDKEPDKRHADAYVLSRRLKEIPKLVDYSQEDSIIAGDTYDGSAPTVSISEDGSIGTEKYNDENLEEVRGAGSGTIMRNLVREEIRHSQNAGLVGSFLNNIWVLLIMLGLVIYGGFYFIGQKKLSPEEMFQAGEKLLQNEEGSVWLRAEREYFIPLLENDPEEWEEKVNPYLQKIEFYRWKKELGWSRVKKRKFIPESDPERFLFEADRLFSAGEYAKAEQKLLSLKHLLVLKAENTRFLKLTNQLLEETKTKRKESNHSYNLLDEGLAEAEKLNKEGKIKEAKNIWKSIIILYEGDPAAYKKVQLAKKALINR